MASQVDIFQSEEFQCLSNFATGYGFWAYWPNPQKRQWWPSAEHFFQAGKFLDDGPREEVRCAEEPGVAKALGRSLQPLRSDWDDVRQSHIRRAMREKLWAHQTVRNVLLSIPLDKSIVFGNPSDAFFGVGSHGNGANIIGVELEQLRTFFTEFRDRRLLVVKVASVGEPLEPLTLTVDVTAAAPSQILAACAAVLAVPDDAVADVQVVTDDGFEKASVEEVAHSAAEFEAFLAKHAQDCFLEVCLEEEAVVTVMDGEFNFLGRVDLAHLCPGLASFELRLLALLPITRYPAFRVPAQVTIDGDDDSTDVLNDTTFGAARDAARQGADVVITVSYTVPDALQPPLRPPPCAQSLGPPHIECGNHSYLAKEKVIDKIRGLVWGAALGDATGLCTEFMTKTEASQQYSDMSTVGPASRVEDKHRARWTQGDWTDDTDQMVLLMDNLVANKGVLDLHTFAASLRQWRDEGFPELGDTAGLGIGSTVNAVLEHPAFVVAPDAAADDVWRRSGCTAAANGAVMRCAGSSMFYFWDQELLEYNAVAAASVTHADPRCTASCVAIVNLLARTLVGVDLTTSERRCQEVGSAAHAAAAHLKQGNKDELWQHMQCAADGLAGLNLSSPSCAIGYTYKPLGAACWAFLHADDFKDAILAITREAGDADSNAVVAGALLGARLGFNMLPRDWLEAVPELQKVWLERKLSSCIHELGLE